MKGVNLRSNRGNILVGIKTTEFIQQLEAHTDESGWSNFVIVPLANPAKGHTYQMFPAKINKDASAERK